MKKYVLSFIIITSLLISTLLAQAPDADNSSRIHPYLQELLNTSNDNEMIPVYIWLADRLSYEDLSMQFDGLDKQARRAEVIRTLKNHAALTQQNVLSYLQDAQSQGRIDRIENIWSINMVAFKAIPSVIYDLDRDYAEIAEIRYDRPISNEEAQDDNGISKYNEENNITEAPMLAPQPGLVLINAPLVWAEGTTGQGVIAANVDGGTVWTHPDLINTIWNNLGEDFDGDGHTIEYNGSAWVFDPGDVNGVDDDGNGKIDDFIGWNFSNNTNDPSTASSSHGTSTAGIVTGDGTGGTETGVAPGAKLMNLNINSAGESGWMAAYQYAFENGAGVTTSSYSAKWGFSPQPNYPAFRQMGDMELAAGTVHTNSTSNDGNSYGAPFNISAPGCVPTSWIHPDQTLLGGVSSTLGAGNVEASTDIIASSSPWGPFAWEDYQINHSSYPYAMPPAYQDYPFETIPGSLGLLKPDVSAPGNGTTSLSTSGGYSSFSGTSGATPHVAGTVALMLSINPNLTPEDVSRIIQTTAVEKGDPGKDIRYGAGRIDAYQAYLQALAELSDPDDPSAPENFTAYSDYSTPTSMLLNWTDPTTLFNGTPMSTSDYTIEVERDGAFVTSVAGGTGTYTDMGLTDGQSYDYEIYAKLIANDSTSTTETASWIAGGSKVPSAPTTFSVTNAGGGDLNANWTSPGTQVDGTPLDDYAGVYLYENGTLLATITRTSADTGMADTEVFTPTTTNAEYYVTAFDNETPINESAGSNTAFPPYAAPYFEDFEAALALPNLWTNETDDDFDWTVDEGGTTSSATGPTVDHTLGSATGNYVYTESSSPNFPSMVAHLTSPTIDMSSVASPGLSFWYHMHGATMGELHVDVYHNGAWVLDVMTPLVGQQQAVQTDPYLQAIVDLSTYTTTPIKVRFRGITGSSFTSDMAIDDVYFTGLSGNPTMVVAPQAIGDTLLVNGTGVLNFDISNTQASPTTLNYTITENPAVSWLSVTPASGAVTSGNTEMIDVNLDATGLAAGSYSTDLIVAGSDTMNYEDTVTVTLEVNDSPVISVNPDSLHFDLLTGEADSTAVSIHNMGSGPLYILGIEDEEINTEGKYSYVQEQKPFVYYDKGAVKPSYGQNTEGSGGPDPFGYKWIDSDEPDGPAYQFTDISTTGNVVTLAPTGTFDPKDEGMATITLPFDVKFYGNLYNQFQVNSNGVIIFDLAYFANTFTNAGIPSNADPNDYIAPFWDDLDGSAGGEIYTEQVGNKFIVQWHNWGSYPAGTENMIFQVVFFANSATYYVVYEHIVDDAQSTVGIENMDGTVGLQVSYNQNYAHDQLLLKISKGVDWLWQNPTMGTIAPMDSLDLMIGVDAAGLLGGDYAAQVLISSNDPVNPVYSYPKVTMHIVGAPDITLDTTALNWGTLYTTVSDTLLLGITNSGTDTLHVTSISTSTPEFTVVGATAMNLLIGERYEIPVVFSSAIAGVFTDGLVITSDATNPAPTVPLDAEAVEPPIIGVNPTSVSDTLSFGQTSVKYFDVSNTGLSPLYFDIVVEDVTVVESIEIIKKGKEKKNSSSVVGNSYTPTSGITSMSTEQSPTSSSAVVTPNEAPWDLQLTFDVELATGALGNAGAEFDGTYFYSTRWASNLIHKYDLAGNLVEEFSIPGVTGLRDLAFDGTYMYGGAAANTIYMMDFVNKTLISTISSPQPVRHIAYDAANDGFWVGNWATDIVLVDRSGSTLGTIPVATHALGGMYGSAYDDLSSGGPYLWVFDQGAGAGTPQYLHQFDLNTLTGTGVTHDVTADLPPNASAIAGGLFVGTGLVSGKATLGGLLQGTPDMYFCYELTDAAGGWVSTNPVADTVDVGGTVQVAVHFNADSTAGTFDANLHVNSNDPVSPVTTVTAQLVVTPATSIEDELTDMIPTKYALHQNYPNPFNPKTTIKYDLKANTRVVLSIYNVLGQKVRTLVNGNQLAGHKSKVWDGLNEFGEQVSTGVYIYRIEAGDPSTGSGQRFVKSRKMVFMK